MDEKQVKRADRVAELLVELSCVPRTDAERVAMLGFAARALQPPELGGPPKGRSFDISGWHAMIVNVLETAFRPSNESGGPGPDAPTEPVEASSDAESEPQTVVFDPSTTGRPEPEQSLAEEILDDAGIVDCVKELEDLIEWARCCGRVR